MVSIVEDSLREICANQPARLFVEIIGPAGAGKSSLFRALQKRNPEIHGETLPPIWEYSYMLFFLKNILSMVTTLSRLLGKGDRCLTRRELAWMAMLNGWTAILRKETLDDGIVSLFDQGPIFLIAVLTQFGPSSLRSPYIQSWWEKIYAQWRDIIDVVIWLDTSDEILINRIRNRDEDHVMKNESDQELGVFLKTFRNTYNDVMEKLALNNPKIRIIKVDSGINSIDDIVCKVMFGINS
jgi:hypothetical protein